MNMHPQEEWEADCLRYRGKTLVGTYRHWCYDWDGLPVDETCAEWASCTCWGEEHGNG